MTPLSILFLAPDQFMWRDVSLTPRAAATDIVIPIFLKEIDKIIGFTEVHTFPILQLFTTHILYGNPKTCIWYFYSGSRFH